MGIETTTGSGAPEWPDRKAHASLSAIEHSVLEGLRSQHPELSNAPSDHTSLIQLEHELADPTTAAQSAQDL
jgi:hypothetical protein